MKRYTIVIVLIVSMCNNVFSQNLEGMPIWFFPSASDGIFISMDWREEPPSQTILNASLVSNGSKGIAYDECGDIAFYAMHTGEEDVGKRLFIYDRDGNVLLNTTTPNGPGLQCMSQDIEMQVVKVPTYLDEWYLIYKTYTVDFGAPNNDGNYAPRYIRYSRVRYDGTDLTVLERDVALEDDNGVQHFYVDGKAVSKEGPYPNSHYLYLMHRDKNVNPFEAHRFIIDANGITFDKTTGSIPSYWWNLTALGSNIELSPTDDKVAMVSRNVSNNQRDVYVFDTDDFDNNTSNYQAIIGNELILQPDGVNILTPMSINDASLLPGLGYLKNFDRKLSFVEFSPDGRFLYIVGGGYAAVDKSNVTYLAQVDLNTTYPYDVRLQVQDVPSGFNVNTGEGCSLSNATCQSNYKDLYGIQSAPDGNLYFRKSTTTQLFVIPNPNDPMPQMIIPGEVDLSTPQDPNIETGYQIGNILDQIDGFEYLDPNIVKYNLPVRKIPCEGNCIDFEVQIQSDGNVIETFQLEGCSEFNYYDTISLCLDITLDYDLVETNGITYEDAIVGGTVQYPPEGYFDFSIDFENINIDLGNDTLVCNNFSYMLDAGSGFVDFQWNTGQTSQTITVTSPGIYGVVGTTSDGCIASDSIEITTVPLLESPDLGNDTTFCESISLVLDAGAGYDSYLWNDASSNQTLIATAAGTYFVETTDTCGNVYYDTLVITDGSANAIDLGNDIEICGAVNLNLNAGSGFTSYLWNTGATSQSINVTAEGEYSVVATNSNGCTASDEIVINSLTPSPAANLGPDVVVCNDTTIVLSPGAGPYTSYMWNNGSSNPTLTVNQPGTYSVTVTDSCGTETTDEIEIIDGAVDEIDLGADSTFCGAVNLLLDAGAGFDSYEWSTGATTQTITATSAGTYSVEVSTTAGCESTGSITLSSITPSPAANLGPDIVVCNDTTIVLSPGAGPYTSYMWNNGSSNPTLTVNQPGTYSVTVTDSCGTETTDEIEIIDGAVDEIDLGADSTFCGAVNLLLDAGAGFDSYEWSTGATTQTITATSAGTYSVEVSTTAGCESTGSITLSSITPSPAANLGPDVVVCNDTTIVLSPGAGPYTSYMWNNGSSNPTLTVNQPGTYSVTVTDSCGTETTDEIEIIDGAVDEIDLGADSTFCGAVNLLLDAGAGFDSYEWSTGATTQTITATSAGTYTVEVSTLSGCESSGSITLSTIGLLPPPDLGEDIIVCADSTIVLSPGLAEYLSYEWNDGSTGQTLTVATTGEFFVNVTDSCGNAFSDTIEIIDGSLIDVNLGDDTTFCGEVDLLLDAGSGFDSYNWNNGATTQTINVTSAGTYIVDVATVAGCGTSDTIVVNSISPSPEPDLGEDTTVCGALDLVLSPGSGPYVTYEWNDGSTNPTLNVTAVGIYSVEVTDSCGNVMTDSIEIINGSVLDITGLLSDTTICSETEIILDGTVSGAETYEWTSNGTIIGNEPTLTISASSDTSITLNVSNLCGEDSETMDISVFETPNAVISGGGVLCNSSDSSSIMVVFTNGNSPFNISVNNGTSSFDFDGIMQDTFVFYVQEEGSYVIGDLQDFNCSGEGSGSADVSISNLSFETEIDANPCLDTEGTITVTNVAGGQSPYQYSINNGPYQSSPDFENLVGGSYSITVMDDAGCTASTTTDIVLEFAEEIELNTYGDTTINLGESVEIGVDISPVGANPDISWSPSNTLDCVDCENPTATPEETTTYTVTATDEFGCTTTEDVTVTVEVVDCGVYIPNAFSPNGDGQNDILYVRLYGEYLSLDFRIYNRWGELVFQTDDITQGWDGIFEGKLQSTDVFGYYMELECITNEIIQQQGNITLLR